MADSYNHVCIVTFIIRFLRMTPVRMMRRRATGLTGGPASTSFKDRHPVRLWREFLAGLNAHRVIAERRKVSTMQKEAILEILSKTEIAQGLEQADLELVLAHSRMETVDKGAVVIAEGQLSEAAYIVLKGLLEVMLLKEDHPNRFTDIHLATLRQGDCFGEYALIDSDPTSASVIAAESSKLLKISRTSFKRIDAIHAKVAKTVYCNLLHILVRRLRKKDKELDLNLDLE